MAKKRKQKEEEKEKPAFIPPTFDEKEFMENEIKNSKISIFVFLYSLLFALLSWFLTIHGEWKLALLLGSIAMVTMANFLEKIKLDLSHLGRKEWLGNYAMFFFAWLGVWIILCNPPFSDLSHPDIEVLTINTEHYNGTWNHTAYHLAFLPKTHTPDWRDRTLQNAERRIIAGEEFNITLRVTDNVGVAEVSAWIDTPSGNDTLNLTHWGGNMWSINKTYGNPGTYDLYIYTEDVNGNTKLFFEDGKSSPFRFTVHSRM